MPANDSNHLETVIDSLLTKLEDLDPTTDEYARVVDQLTKLTALRPPKRESSIKPDTLIGAAASLTGIFAILNFEKMNPLTSKALSFVPKPKL